MLNEHDDMTTQGNVSRIRHVRLYFGTLSSLSGAICEAGSYCWVRRQSEAVECIKVRVVLVAASTFESPNARRDYVD